MGTCAFRHEQEPDRSLVELDASGIEVRICSRCLVLITIHRRIHHMRLEQLIPEMVR